MKSSQFQHEKNSWFGGIYAKLKHISVFHFLLMLLLAVVLAGCKSNKPVLTRMQERSAPTPPHRPLPYADQKQAKSVMVTWIETQLKNKYHVVEADYVLTKPGFIDGVAMGAKAGRYVEQNLGATLQPGTWAEGEYQFLLWKYDSSCCSSSMFIAFVIARDPMPGMDGQRLVGFFALLPTGELIPVIVGGVP